MSDNLDRIEIATAIANARGGRRGVPPIVNILDVLPEKLVNEVLDDADAVIDAIKSHNVSTPVQEGGAVGEIVECPPQPEFRCAPEAPDESRELALIEFARSYVVRGLDENVSYEQGVLADFNESRKR